MSEDEFVEALKELLDDDVVELFRELIDVMHTFRGAAMRIVQDDRLMVYLKKIIVEAHVDESGVHTITLDQWIQQGLEEYADMSAAFPKFQKLMDK